jgi:hypothetical protein
MDLAPWTQLQVIPWHGKVKVVISTTYEYVVWHILEKEALAHHHGRNNHHHTGPYFFFPPHLYGRKFNMFKDHKPL